MTQIMELTRSEFLKIMINTLRDLMETVYSMHEQMDNVSREIEILMNQKEILEIENTNRNECF